MGVIALGRKITETRYTAEEISLLQTLTNQTSVAVKNAVLHEESLAKIVLEEELAVAAGLPEQKPGKPRARRRKVAAPPSRAG